MGPALASLLDLLTGGAEALLGIPASRLSAFGWAYVGCTLALLGYGLWRLRRGDATPSASLAQAGAASDWAARLLGIAALLALYACFFSAPAWLARSLRDLLVWLGADNQGSFALENKSLEYSLALAAQLLVVGGLLLLNAGVPGVIQSRPDGADAERLSLDRRGLARLGQLFAACVALMVLGTLGWDLFAGIAESQGQSMPRDVQPLVQEIARWQGPSWLLSILFLSVTLGAPVFEEIAFRGILYPAMRASMARGWAIAANGLLFGMMHGNLAALLPISLMGALLCVIRDRHGIGPCIVVHALNNTWTVFWLVTAPEVMARA